MAKTNKQPSKATYMVRRAGARALTAGLAAGGTYAAMKGINAPALTDPAIAGTVVGMGATLGAFAPDLMAVKMGRQFKK